MAIFVVVFFWFFTYGSPKESLPFVLSVTPDLGGSAVRTLFLQRLATKKGAASDWGNSGKLHSSCCGHVAGHRSRAAFGALPQ